MPPGSEGFPMRIMFGWAIMATIAFGLSAAAESQESSPPPADLIVVNGNVYTLDAHRPRAEALACRDGRLAAVGSNADMSVHRGERTRVLDLAGQTVLPGLIDAHGHVLGLGSFALGRIDLSAARSFDEVVALVSDKARRTPAGQWILGGRWDHESWPQRVLPTHAALSRAVPDHPVWITRVDGHAGLANALALQRAGITRETPEPAGGEILRDERGEPTGLLIDNAMDLLARHIDQPPADTAELIRKAQAVCLSMGLTGVHDAGVSPAEVQAYAALERSGELKLRIYAMIHGEQAQRYFEDNGLRIGDRLTVRACKLYADGAMGSRGAWLLSPYSDRPVDEDGRAFTGLAVMPPDFIRAVAQDALARGYQVCTHAIGDRGNRETLDAYAAAFSAAQQTASAERRFRIEHAQLLAPEDIGRFARLGVIASMQPTHCTSDMRWVEARVGDDRARGAYAWSSLLRRGAVVAGGSDFPVESPNPLLGLYAAVTRQNLEAQPTGGWHPEERLTREEALRLFTIDAAYAAFEETLKGSLEKGKLADFVVLDRDVMRCAAADIPGTKVVQTIIAGAVVFDRAAAATP